MRGGVGRRTMIWAATAAVAASLASTAAAQPVGPADARLKALYTDEWRWRLAEDARSGPDDESNLVAHLPREDPAAQAARLQNWRATLAAVDAIPSAELSPPERINQAVYRDQLQALIADQSFRTYEAPFNSDSSFWSELASEGRKPFHTVQEYQAYIGRLNDVPRYYREEIANMRAGLARGFTVPRATLDGRDASIAAAADPAHPEDNPFYAPFKDMPSSLPAAEQAQLRRAGIEAVKTSVIPAHQALLAFFRNDYLPRARTTLAAEALPDGPAFYRSQIREYTTLDLSPDEIHRIGLEQVAKIHAQMLATLKASGFQGSFPEFLQFLRTDPRFYPKTGDELLMRASWISKRQDDVIGRWIGHLSRERFGIEPVPAAIAPFYTSARGGTKACLFNTYDLPSRPLYDLTALALHECSPGHALQGELAEENTALPDFRRYTYISAYGEGWALYSEKLGEEMGLYQTPYDEFGRETFDMWRACRLVVDTGLHHLGWTRQQARDFLATNTALSQHDIDIEVDRYISWPGQALSYKLGELEIERLRAKSQAALGAKFDIRAFHDAVLAPGSAPLPVLDQVIDDFIASGGRDPTGAPLTD